jgi:hypothetical protein
MYGAIAVRSQNVHVVIYQAFQKLRVGMPIRITFSEEIIPTDGFTTARKSGEVESSQEPKQNPAQKGSGGGRKEAIEIHQKDCHENEERRQGEKRKKEIY